MSDKELADYLNADLETRYQIHKAVYFQHYPECNIEKFHRFETAYLKRQIQKYNTKEKIEPEETKIHLSQIEILEYIDSISSSKTPQQAEAKPKKLEAPTISLFCTLMNDSGTIRRYESESVENYCKRICDEFKLKYTDRVRQNFDITADTKDNRTKLKSRLLPIIETETKVKLLQYLDTKHPTEQNLYG
jgi:hypothetical protein